MSIHPIELCQHIKMNGDRCGAPALRGEKLCRFHNFCGSIQVDVSTSAAVPAAPFFLPALEDAASIQLAITQVCEHLLHRRLDAKKAGILLYAMQVASSNLGRLSQEKTQENPNESPSDAPVSSEPDCLPPGTIQASERRRRSVVGIKGCRLPALRG
jgi:hypothetical protein